MNVIPDKQIFEAAARQLRMDTAFVEKDWFVTQVISIVAGIRQEGFEVIFSGGTALSKAHSLLYRFSEDVDFRVIAAPHLHTRRTLSGFKNSVLHSLRENGFKIEDHHITARDGNRFFAVELEYETAFPRTDALRPHIQIEMTVRDIQLPCLPLPVSSFLNELARRPPEVPVIGCIDPVESAADKLSAIAWRIPDRVRESQDDDPSIVRHIHDLAMLKDRALASPGFRNMVSVAMQEDDSRAKNDPSLEGMPMADKLRRMLEALATDTAYPEEYDRFVKSVSYAREGQAPDFASAAQSVRVLVDAVTD